MPPRVDADVVVVGAGIAGTAAAIALHRAGFSSVVLERAQALGNAGAALGVQSNGVIALQSLGAAAPVLRAGVPVEHYRLLSWRHRELAYWCQGDLGRRLGAPSVTVERAVLQRALLDRLPVGALRIGTECVGVEQGDGVVRVLLGDGGAVTGRVVVGADGLRSVIRPALRGAERLRVPGYTAFRGISDHPRVDLPVDSAQHTLGLGRTFGTWALGGGRRYWVATIETRRLLGHGAIPHRSLLLDAFATAHSTVTDLIRRTPDERILRTRISDRAPMRGWSSGRVLLIGDAAHPTTPTTGQGGTQALVDAVVLGEFAAGVDLTDAAAVGDLFRRFEDVRAPVTAQITDEAWGIGAMHHVNVPVARLLRDTVLRATPRRVWTKRMTERVLVSPA